MWLCSKNILTLAVLLSATCLVVGFQPGLPSIHNGPRNSRTGTLKYRVGADIEADHTYYSKGGVMQKTQDDSNQEETNTRDEYWYNPRIHKLGNTGLFGALHAAIVPLSTKVIDILAYKGLGVREQIANCLYEEVGKSKAMVLDMACGVGISTRALVKAFPDAEAIIGIDTSEEMIAMAQAVSKHTQGCAAHKKGSANPSFMTMNAERTALPDDSFDLVTIMYAFHEAPALGRESILSEAHRVLKDGGTLAVVDISPDYTPTPKMLRGEPYILEYMENISNQLKNVEGFTNFIHDVVVPGQVNMWRLTCDKH